MSLIYNIYCDESCHLEHDHQKSMVLGAIWCPLEKVSGIAAELRALKTRHGFKPGFEIKWTKASPAKTGFYLEVMDYFFAQVDLHFRALIVPDKTVLDHEALGQSHDAWYYKMYFQLLSAILNPEDQYCIYIDIKDTRGAEKIRKLHEVLSSSVYDFSRQIIRRVQLVQSHEVELLQVADLLIGAVSYANRGLSGNSAKLALLARMRERSKYKLTQTTLMRENKVNLLRWRPDSSVS